MPPVIQLRRRQESSASDTNVPTTPLNISRMKLLLPSALERSIACDSRLLEMEFELRQAQCADALEDVRHNLRLKVFLIWDKKKHQVGQLSHTRSLTLIERAMGHVTAAADEYIIARTALIAIGNRLGKDGLTNYPALKKEQDLTMLPVEDLQEKTRKEPKRGRDGEILEWEIEQPSEGRRRLSWIWRDYLGRLVDGGDTGYHDSV